MKIPELLFAEEAAYSEKQIKRSSGKKDLFVISDLHLPAGFNNNSNDDGTENFFADGAFSRFIDYLLQQPTGPSILVINGDFVDFLRIRNIPETVDELVAWQQALQDVGMVKSTDELKRSITKKEINFGFKTHDYKSVWKLLVCAKGHPQVFESLALWLAKGNDLLIVKGNHDLEWYWKAVCDYLRILLAQHASEFNGSVAANTIKNSAIHQITFADSSVVIDNKIYIEHGHRYENFTTVDGPPVLANTSELNLPFGSFFNRYLINRLELSYPQIDDVRPRQKILPLLLQERFPLAIKLLFCYVPFAIRVIPKRKYLYALRYLFQFLLIIGLPLAITAIAIYKGLPHHTAISPSGILQGVLTSLKNLAFLFVSYFIGRLQSMLLLTAPDGLYKNAEVIFDKFPDVQFVTFGHTHNPEQTNYKNTARRYYNTGTWMPVFETDAGEIRGDKIYSFLHLPYNMESSKLQHLMSWNDDALRTEALVLIDRK